MYEDYLFTPIDVGDEVVWAAGGRSTHGIRRGIITELIQSDDMSRPHVRVKATHGGAGGVRPANTVVVICTEWGS